MPGTFSVFILTTIYSLTMSYHAKIKVFYRLPNAGKSIFLRAWNTLTERVGKRAACGIASSFLGLQNPWLRLPAFQGDSLTPSSTCTFISPELSYLHVPTGGFSQVGERNLSITKRMVLKRKAFLFPKACHQRLSQSCTLMNGSILHVHLS